MKLLLIILVSSLRVLAAHPAISQLQSFASKRQSDEIAVLIDSLDSPDYDKRQQAFETLRSLPTIPPDLRNTARNNPSPEIRSRLAAILRLHPIESENGKLDDVLLRIHLEKVKGALPSIFEIVRAGTWKPTEPLLAQAAITTFRPEDLPLIQKSLADPDPAIRALAAKIRDRTHHPASTISLYNGKDLSNWLIFEPTELTQKTAAWKIKENQLISVAGKTGEIRTRKTFKNYLLHITYQVEDPDGDGGIGIFNTHTTFNPTRANRGEPQYLEVQLEPANTGDLWLLGGFKIAPDNQIRGNNHLKRTSPAPYPARQWHTMKIKVKNGTMTAIANNILQNQAETKITKPSNITIRNEGHKITYKQILLTPIP